MLPASKVLIRRRLPVAHRISMNPPLGLSPDPEEDPVLARSALSFPVVAIGPSAGRNKWEAICEF
jgi:hypothetical protein